jgi:hypothetical protein
MHRAQCVMCDKVTSTPLSERGWCMCCEQEFEEIQMRQRWQCTSVQCSTPVTCATAKRCCKVTNGET